MIVTDEVDKKRELKRFASSVPVLKDCMNFGRLFNVAAKRASKWRKLNESPIDKSGRWVTKSLS